MMPKVLSSRSLSLDTTFSRLFGVFSGSCCSSESESVCGSRRRLCLFFAVGGPTKGALFFFGGSSSKEVGRSLASVFLCIARDRRSADLLTYSWVASSSSSSSSLSAVKRGRASPPPRLLLSVGWRAGLGFANVGTFVRRLLTVVLEAPEVPGVGSSSS